MSPKKQTKMKMKIKITKNHSYLLTSYEQNRQKMNKGKNIVY